MISIDLASFFSAGSGARDRPLKAAPDVVRRTSILVPLFAPATACDTAAGDRLKALPNPSPIKGEGYKHAKPHAASRPFPSVWGGERAKALAVFKPLPPLWEKAWGEGYARSARERTSGESNECDLPRGIGLTLSPTLPDQEGRA